MKPSILAVALFAVSAFARTEVPLAPLAFGPVPPFFRPAIATDGVRSFAVWNDGRDRVSNVIYGARLGENGELMDPVGVRLIEGSGQPAIAYGDGRYFVVTSTTRFAIVDRDANVVARGAISEEVSLKARVVFNGRDFVVFWGYDSVKVSIVDRDGRVTTPPSTLVPPAFEVRLQAAATGGSRIVVLYTRGVELRAAVASATGAPISDSAIAQSVFPEAAASLAATGSGFVAAWEALVGHDIVAARLDANGAFVRGPSVVVSGAAGPTVVANRLFTLEGDLQDYRLVVRTLADDLTAGAPVTVLDSQFLSVDAYAVAGREVVARLFDPNRPVAEDGLYSVDAEAPGEPRLVSRAALTQLEPRLATAENGTLVAWREEEALRATFLARSSASTTFIVAAGIVQSHSVAAEQRTHLVTWESGQRVLTRLYREHIPLTQTQTLDTYGQWPVAASDGNGFVVAWARMGELRIARVTAGGEITDSYAIPYGNVTSLAAPALACDSGECIVVWRNQTARQICPRFSCIVVDERVMALRLNASLSPIDRAPLVLSEDLSGVTGIVAAADHGAYAVSWVNQSQTYVRTLADDDTIIVPGEHPSIAREDGAWLVVREVNGELVALRLRDAGQPYEFVLMRDAQARTAPALAQSIVAYQRTTRGEAAGGVPRIFVTTIAPAEPRRRVLRTAN